VSTFCNFSENPTEADELFVGDAISLENSHFHTGGPLWFLVHGYNGEISDSFPSLQVPELLSLSPSGNVILLEWAQLSQGPNYAEAVRNVRDFAKKKKTF